MAAFPISGRPVDVACVAQADSGHMNPIMLIAESLAERGHRVRVVTFGFGAGKYEQRVQKLGGRFVGLPCPKSEEEIHSEAQAKGRVPFLSQRDLMRVPLLEVLKAERPDVVVADFSTLAAFEVGRDLDLPCIMNVPGPLEMLANLARVPRFDQMYTFGGFGFAVTPFKLMSVPLLVNMAGLKELADALMEHAEHSLIFVNTFFGLEEAKPCPPQVFLTGPLSRPPDAGEGLAVSHPELHQFLETAGDVVYITLGSMVKPEAFLVKALYEAMRLVGCYVVWSLKEECQAFLPRLDGEDPHFFVHKWLPQPALLCHPKVKAVVSHCGWGGCLECVQAGKPVLALPFFADQPDNAEILVKSGMARWLCPRPRNSMSSDGVGCYKPSALQPERMAEATREVLTQEVFSQAAQHLKQLSVGPGLGRSSVCDHVEGAAVNGTKHLTNPGKVRHMTRHPPALLTVALFAALAAVAFALLRHL